MGFAVLETRGKLKIKPDKFVQNPDDLEPQLGAGATALVHFKEARGAVASTDDHPPQAHHLGSV